jgi:triacylglycerol esterase/lipase EstA (alpha/beta hydrolase family)
MGSVNNRSGMRTRISRMLVVATVAALAAVAAPAGASAALPVHYGSAALDEAVTAELYHPTSLAGANNGCKPSAAHPYPVVLVHATFTDEGANWLTLSPLLANAGYCVYAFNYGEDEWSYGGRIDGLNYIEKSAEELSTFVNKVLAQTKASQVDLVGHSEGGMMPNYYLKFLGGASKVNTFVALSPSNHGTTLDGLQELLNKIPWESQIAGLVEALGLPSLIQQEEGGTFQTHLFAGGDTVAGPRYAVIETDHDEVVTPYTNAFLNGPNVTNITLQNQCPTDPVEHIGMAADSPAMQNVLNQLSASPSSSFKATCTNFGVGL